MDRFRVFRQHVLTDQKVLNRSTFLWFNLGWIDPLFCGSVCNFVVRFRDSGNLLNRFRKSVGEGFHSRSIFKVYIRSLWSFKVVR